MPDATVHNPVVGWFLDELAHAGDEHLDPEYVARYDRKAVTDPSEDLDLLCRLGLNANSVLVDLGAGTGSLALAAAQVCRRVTVVDVSATMLAALRVKAARLGLENIEYVQAGFLTYAHVGGADFVYSRNALHHLPDFWKVMALERVASVLGAGGLLYLRDLVFSFDPDHAEQAIEDWLAQAPEQTREGWTRAELEVHVRQEYSTFTWLLEPMLERAGFAIREATYSSSCIFAAYVCVKR